MEQVLVNTDDIKPGDYKGFKIIEKTSSDVNTLDSTWKIQCTCGHIFTNTVRRIKNRIKRSCNTCYKCGKLNKKGSRRTSDPVLVAQKSIYSTYKCRAKKDILLIMWYRHVNYVTQQN